MKRYEPLSSKLRPKTINDVIGQKHLIGKGKILNRMISSGSLSSMILYGPPGTGKTSLASAIAGSSSIPFYSINASNLKKSDITSILDNDDETSIIFLDEIHRLNKTNQDLLLPDTETGRIILIGATTENPYLEVNKALRSRLHIFELKPLTDEDIVSGVEKVTKHLVDELKISVSIDKEALDSIVMTANGDLRNAMNNVELAIRSTKPNNGKVRITLDVISEIVGGNILSYDKAGDSHYNILSAFQKSIRGSDVNASLYYLAILLESGDLESIFRRLGIIAYEDIGFGNVNAVSRTMGAIELSRNVGLPEARIPLSFAVIDLALSPKSNTAYRAIDLALADIKKGRVGEVPDHLKDSHYFGADKLGRGKGYKYPHDYEGHYINQQYLPDKMKDVEYFKPDGISKYEQFLKSMYEDLN